MSRFKQRKQKNCLNCETKITDLYCPHCGQENIEAKETFWHLFAHFFNDITHFDGKFFSTSKYLLIKPGFLSTEYSAGKRVSYLNPIRMYLFTSAIFFLIFFSVYNPEHAVKSEKTSSSSDTASNGLTLSSNDYKSVAGYDSTQALLSKSERDGWIMRQINIKLIHIKEKYGNDTKLMLTAWFNKFMHTSPQMLFVSLPFFALLLKLLYHRKKEYYYVDHFVYSLHLYCALFLFILLGMGLSGLQQIYYLGWLGYIKTALILYTFYYIYKSMRNFYKAGRGRTILNYILLLFFSFIMMLMLFLTFGIFSLFTV